MRHKSEAALFLADHLVSDVYCVDVGCAFGFDAGLRHAFGERFSGVGFDPNVKEIERLRSIETSSKVVFEDCFIEASPHVLDLSAFERMTPRVSQRIRQRLAEDQMRENDHATKTAENRWRQTELADRHIDLSAYLGGREVDFFKIDVDGPDFEIMKSATSVIAGALGVKMEVNWIGSGDPNEHAFHNTDPFLRKLGFSLYYLDARTYSMAALPMPYVLPYPAQATRGRPVQGDALYFRDPVSKPLQLSRERVLKLAALMALADQHDSAAEVLIHYRPDGLDLDAALDHLAEEAVGRSYKAQIELFERDDPCFYPPYPKPTGAS